MSHISSTRRAVSAAAIHHAPRVVDAFGRAAGVCRRLALPWVAVLAFTVTGCTHTENATSTSTETSTPVPATSFLGTWKIPDAKPLGRYQPSLGGVSFKADHTGTWTFVGYGSDRRPKDTVIPSTWNDLGNGKLRIVARSSANEFSYSLDNGKLIMTPPGNAGAGYVFERVK